MKKLMYSFVALLALALASCGEEKPTNWLQEYEVEIAIDETFKPIMEEALDQFNKRYIEEHAYIYT